MPVSEQNIFEITDEFPGVDPATEAHVPDDWFLAEGSHALAGTTQHQPDGGGASKSSARISAPSARLKVLTVLALGAATLAVVVHSQRHGTSERPHRVLAIERPAAGRVRGAHARPASESRRYGGINVEPTAAARSRQGPTKRSAQSGQSTRAFPHPAEGPRPSRQAIRRASLAPRIKPSLTRRGATEGSEFSFER
jgi:hypothetical protein